MAKITYCECCGRLKTDIKWRKDTELNECEDCYLWWLIYKDSHKK